MPGTATTAPGGSLPTPVQTRVHDGTYQHDLPGMQAEAAATFASLMDEAEE